MSPLAILAGLATGLMLGLFGSGGSIITLPALLYLLDVPTKSAIAMSLGIVGVTAAISAVTHWRRGNVDMPVATVFGLFGVMGTYGGAKLGVITPDLVQLMLFAAIMYAASWRMFKPGHVEPKTANLIRLDCQGTASLICFDYTRVGHVALHGIVVGVLTGMVGVGGGFLIVPALVLLSGLPMKQATGTSLVIVSAKSFAGFAGYLGAIEIDYDLMAIFTAIAIAGSFAGTAISKHLSAEKLKKGFAVFLVVVASYIVIKETMLG
ncbi:putative sulfite/sulfoacetate exporter of taurine metabolism [Rhodospirillaceae bacterium LM-1]|nr:putative sulfite/sulfoacetate exporter of taurine metabolism [Rhodospirillaceae bacterium LM-1]